mmetsp:Transcript_30342/g.63404  ORF Transcript_30342/g.63404 Transcript_30342/m.63404 type:complete len:408 (-) Transcript_30342:265-1488(-)
MPSNMNRNTLALLVVQVSSLLISTHAACEAECTTKDATNDFSFQYTGRCTPDTFNDKITNTETHECLVCLYNVDKAVSLTSIDSVVQSLCEDAYAADVFSYTDIARKGAQFDNEYYSGGGEWNYEIETASGEDILAYDASRVDDIYYYEAQRKVIEFPENIESFNPFNRENSFNGIQDLDGCDLNAAFCCFAQDRQAGDNNGNCATPYEYNCIDKDPADNTNICYIDHARSGNSGFSIFGDLQTGKENIEGSVHCHGFTWGDDPLSQDNVYKGNLLFYVSMYDHMTQRGYVRNIPGSPMCACAENMAVVTRADCTQVQVDEKVTFRWTVADSSLEAVVYIDDIDYNACTGLDANNNLLERARKLEDIGALAEEKVTAIEEILVGSTAGKCNAAIETFLGTKNVSRID